MRLDASQFASLAAAFAEAATHTEGVSLYLPAGTYAGDGLLVPTTIGHMEGDGYGTYITGTMTYQRWGPARMVGFRMDSAILGTVSSGCHHADWENLFILGQFTFANEVFYNNFYNCYFRSPDTSILVNTFCQDCHWWGGSILNQTSPAIVMNVEAESFGFFGVSFEGIGTNNTIAPVATLKGANHTFFSGRFEAGNGNHWSPATVVFGPTTLNCLIDRSLMKGYGFTIIDQGTNNAPC